jgi:hypothetical protein
MKFIEGIELKQLALLRTRGLQFVDFQPLPSLRPSFIAPERVHEIHEEGATYRRYRDEDYNRGFHGPTSELVLSDAPQSTYISARRT